MVGEGIEQRIVLRTAQGSLNLRTGVDWPAGLEAAGVKVASFSSATKSDSYLSDQTQLIVFDDLVVASSVGNLTSSTLVEHLAAVIPEFFSCYFVFEQKNLNPFSSEPVEFDSISDRIEAPVPGQKNLLAEEDGQGDIEIYSLNNKPRVFEPVLQVVLYGVEYGEATGLSLKQVGLEYLAGVGGDASQITLHESLGGIHLLNFLWLKQYFTITACPAAVDFRVRIETNKGTDFNGDTKFLISLLDLLRPDSFELIVYDRMPPEFETEKYECQIAQEAFLSSGSAVTYLGFSCCS